uniref:Tudor domain-containing protein n=1 Tax=Ciona intestinalis TaxID=7719 RepID=H2XKL7_CIOIN
SQKLRSTRNHLKILTNSQVIFNELQVGQRVQSFWSSNGNFYEAEVMDPGSPFEKTINLSDSEASPSKRKRRLFPY